MKLLKILPHERETTADAVIDAVRAAVPLPPAAESLKAYCAALSRLLLDRKEARPFPELQALGFWLRPASLENMAKDFLAAPRGTFRAPAGIVFQLPPGNVATLFGYTSSIALLGGNTVLVRLPGKSHPAQALLIDYIREALQAEPALREKLVLLRYEHDDKVTEALSKACDARLVWGNDETVDHIRRLALPPLARHVSFGDRFSALAVRTESYLALDETDRARLVQKLFNDIYLFDQMACSSPRLLVWIGNKETAARAAEDFYPRLSVFTIQQHYEIGTAENFARLTAGFLALHDLAPEEYKVFAPHLVIITLPDLTRLASFKSVNYGFGLLMAARLDTLDGLAHYAERRDQTLVCYGFDESEKHRFAALCQGSGFDRIVPPGQASIFDPIWDGYNLFDLMTRLVRISA